MGAHNHLGQPFAHMVNIFSNGSELSDLLCSCGTGNVEVAEGNDSQRCYGPLSQQDIAELATADGLARRDDEAVEILRESRKYLPVDRSVRLYVLDHKVGVQ